MSSPNVVAVINTSTDVTDMLRTAFEFGGFITVTALTTQIRDGEIDLERFVSQHDPKVIVYDIGPPYEPNWRLFEQLQSLPVMRERFFVVTSTYGDDPEGQAGPHDVTPRTG